VDFVGSLDTDKGGYPFPDPAFDHDHEGHWGWRADEILAELPGWLTGYTPDVALIHLGSNDAIQGNSVNSTLNELEAIVGVLRNDNPQITIFLAQILPLGNTEANTKIEGINQGLMFLAANLDQAQSRIILVDQNTGWSISDFTYDGVHPNPAGEERMAQRWYDAFDAFFTPVNVAPEISAQTPLTLAEDQSLTLSVEDFTITDPDSEQGDMILMVSGGDHYSVDGNTVTPELHWHGTLSIEVRVSDGTDTSNPFDAMVEVTAVNDPPAITDQVELSLDEDSQLNLRSSFFFINDPDSNPDDMSLVINGGNNYMVNESIITPDENWHGTLNVQVRVNDGWLESDPFEAVITVNSVNDAPLVSDIPDQTILKGEQFETINLGSYVEDDDTPDSLMNWTVAGASQLSVTLIGQEAVIYPIDNQWSGTEILVFIATDGDQGKPLSSWNQAQFTIESTVSAGHQSQEGVRLYPNPSSGEFTVSTFGSAGNLRMEIFDTRGRMIQRKKGRGNSSLQGDLTAHPSGIYHIRVISGEHVTVLKFLKD
jgi:hypothetical protein